MKKRSSFIKDILEVLICAVIISFILLRFILMPCEVNGSSMYPLLHDKDRAYSFRISKLFGIDRFDICIIDVEEKFIVKRVIGMPNDTIEFKDNVLYINGESYDEPYLDNVKTDDFEITLKDDEYFCMGDNREVSKDSRYYGPFSSKQIIATKMLVVYPFESFGVKK